ncbi:DUF2510 domain-containing protein [Modestobacter sp. I12A-02662]|uniref:DUF2510 domain-containing protein n=1 Tax=Modestobacter sp. I12A-02662 TaxID=1730496 RepID=UPI0034DFA799
MSGPQGAPAPGWYPDPDGAPGLVRWWNGMTWSDVTTPVGPGVEVGAPFQPTAAPQGEQWGGGAPEQPRRRRRWPWVAGLGALLLVAVLVLAGVLSGGSTEEVADPPLQVPPTQAGPTFPPGTVRIFDEPAGISYPFLGDGWYEWDRGPQLETTETAGQYFVTQEDLPDGFDVFIAQCTSGPLGEGFGWSGPESLQATTTAIADYVRAAHYPTPNERTVRRDEAVTVDGAAGWVHEFDLSWDVAGYDSTGERAALLLVDVGRPAPALLYLSIPNTHAELYGVIDRVLADVQLI